jgi:hypothetical protein
MWAYSLVSKKKKRNFCALSPLNSVPLTPSLEMCIDPHREEKVRNGKFKQKYFGLFAQTLSLKKTFHHVVNECHFLR